MGVPKRGLRAKRDRKDGKAATRRSAPKSQRFRRAAMQSHSQVRGSGCVLGSLTRSATMVEGVSRDRIGQSPSASGRKDKCRRVDGNSHAHTVLELSDADGEVCQRLLEIDRI